MPRVSNELTAQYWDPDATGPVAQVDLSAVQNPGTIAAGATFDTGAIYSDGFKDIAVGVLMNAGGTITLQRYLDAAMLLPVGAAVTATITGGTATVLTSTDDLPFNYLRVTIKNTAATVATIAAFGLLLNAN